MTTATVAGMSLDASGRSCSSLSSFNILEPAFDGGGNVATINVVFALICNGSTTVVVGAVKL